MDSLKVTCILLLPAEMVGEQVLAIAGVPEEVAVPGVDRPAEVWEEPGKTGSLFRLIRTSTCTVWERISIQLPR